MGCGGESIGPSCMCRQPRSPGCARRWRRGYFVRELGKMAVLPEVTYGGAPTSVRDRALCRLARKCVARNGYLLDSEPRTGALGEAGRDCERARGSPFAQAISVTSIARAVGVVIPRTT